MTAQFSELKDTSVYITGGGNGIGAALTEGFLKQGARVAIVGRSDATDFCDEMEQTIRKSTPFHAMRHH